MGEGGALPFSLPSFPFSPETPDTQAKRKHSAASGEGGEEWRRGG